MHNTKHEHFLMNPDFDPACEMGQASKQSIAYGYLCSSIISGRMAPGTPIIEREVCERLGVSRTPVREALRRLSSEGLVDFITNRGAFVSGLTKEKVRQLYEVKEALETMAAVLCTRRAGEKELREIEKCINTQERHVAEGAIEQSLDDDVHFHILLVKSCGNPMLEQHAISLTLQTRRMMSAYDVNRMSEYIRQHRSILKGIRTGNVSAVVTAVGEHIKTVSEFQLEHWGDVTFTG